MRDIVLHCVMPTRKRLTRSESLFLFLSLTMHSTVELVRYQRHHRLRLGAAFSAQLESPDMGPGDFTKWTFGDGRE